APAKAATSCSIAARSPTTKPSPSSPPGKRNDRSSRSRISRRCRSIASARSALDSVTFFTLPCRGRVARRSEAQAWRGGVLPQIPISWRERPHPARCARHPPPAGEGEEKRSMWMKSLRQRDEFTFVARDDVEAASLPLGFGLLYALFARGDEIPPDMARPVHRGAAEENDARCRRRGRRHFIARPNHQQLARGEAVARNVDLAGDDVEAALLGGRVDRQHGGGFEQRIGKNRFGQRRHRRALPIKAADDDADALAVAGD